MGATYDDADHSYTIGLTLLVVFAAAACLFTVFGIRQRQRLVRQTLLPPVRPCFRRDPATPDDEAAAPRQRQSKPWDDGEVDAGVSRSADPIRSTRSAPAEGFSAHTRRVAHRRPGPQPPPDPSHHQRIPDDATLRGEHRRPSGPATRRPGAHESPCGGVEQRHPCREKDRQERDRPPRHLAQRRRTGDGEQPDLRGGVEPIPKANPTPNMREGRSTTALEPAHQPPHWSALGLLGAVAARLTQRPHVDRGDRQEEHRRHRRTPYTGKPAHRRIVIGDRRGRRGEPAASAAQQQHDRGMAQENHRPTVEAGLPRSTKRRVVLSMAAMGQRRRRGACPARTPPARRPAPWTHRRHSSPRTARRPAATSPAHHVQRDDDPDSHRPTRQRRAYGVAPPAAHLRSSSIARSPTVLRHDSMSRRAG